MDKKKITIISANFYPEETAVGLYNTQFSKFLVEKGYDVNIITGFPYYPQWKILEKYQKLPNYFTETIQGVEVIRYKQYVPKTINFKGRVLLMLSLFYGTFVNIFKIKETDLVICILPFSISMIPSYILSKRMNAKFWVHVQDFEFDLAFDSGVVKSNNLIIKLFKKTLAFFERKMLNSAQVVSSISYSMLEKIKIKSSHTQPFYFPNWVSSENINPKISLKHRLINTEKFTLLYSGNIGEKQNWHFLENLCNVISPSDNIEILIVGDGAFKNNLKIMLKDFLFIRFYDPVPYGELNDLLCSASVHFLFQKNEVVDTVMPSKILAMMASGKPSIITGNKNSEVASIMNESNGSFYFSDNEVMTIYEKLIELKNNINLSEELGSKARLYVLEKFSSDKILESLHVKILATI